MPCLPEQLACKRGGVHIRLDVLAEGESLFADSTALVGYSLLLAVLVGSAELTVGSGVSFFLQASLGGALFGYVLARIFCWLYVFVGESHIARNTLSICLAYISFFLVEVLFDWSGVMAVVAVALVLGSTGRAIYSPSNWRELLNLSGQLNFIAKSFVFVMVGIVAPSMIAGMGLDDAKLIGLMFIAASLARAITIYFMLPALSRMNLADPVETPLKTVMFWGAARGAIPLALAIAVIETPQIDASVSNFIGTMVCGFVLMTLFINSATMPVLLKLLGLKKFDKVDIAIRDKAILDALRELSQEMRLDEPADRQRAALVQSVARGYDDRSRELIKAISAREDLQEREWLVIALSIIAQHERQIYLRYLEDRLVTLQNVRILLGSADDLIDGVRVSGEKGYYQTTVRNLSFNWQARLVIWVHLHIGVSLFLRKVLARRFEKLITMVPVMEEVAANVNDRVGALVSGNLLQQVSEAVNNRLRLARADLKGLHLAYPEYGAKLEKNLLQLGIARLEQHKYEDMLTRAVISPEVCEDLVAEIEERITRFSVRPELDLGLAPADLLAKVPLFAHLGDDRTNEVCQLLRPRFAVPGERIIKKGEVGDAMYFISTGAVEIILGEGMESVLLGSGKFFGEMALVNNERRNADVVAEEYCRLLVIYNQDFQSLMKHDRYFREEIESVTLSRGELTRDQPKAD